MAAGDTRFCDKCKKTINEKEFYGSNNLEKYPDGKLNTCKKCLTMHVDNWDPNTYLWILQECDVPYVPEEYLPKYKVIGKSIVASVEELEDNYRAHSARLRVIERIKD